MFNRLDVSSPAMLAVANDGPVDAAAFYAGMAVMADNFPLRLAKLAFFSPSILLAWRGGSSAASIMSSVEFTQFWTRDITVVPIVLPGHWMVAVVYCGLWRIEVFDSLADSKECYIQGEVRTRRAMCGHF